MIQAFAKTIRKLDIKIKSLIKRGYVSSFIKDNRPTAIAQVNYFDKTSISEILSPYGLNIGLPEKTDLIIFNIQGKEGTQICMGYSKNDRFMNLEQGEVVIGSPKTKSYIKFKEDGKIEIESKEDINIIVNGNVNIDATKINLGIGGAKIARLGDQVTVDGSTGTITSAGENTSI